MKLISNLLFALFLITGCTPGGESANDFRFSTPEEPGFSSDLSAGLDDFFNRVVEEEKISGAVALIARDGAIVLEQSWGWQNVEDEHPMEIHHLFRIASMTKAITSFAILQLYDEGLLEFDDAVEMYIPEFADPTVLTSFDRESGSYEFRPASRSITLHDLLLHTSGLAYSFTHPYLGALYSTREIPAILAKRGVTLEPVMARLGEIPLAHDPGARYTYGLSSDVLGRVVEVVSGLTLADYVDKHIFEPLGMNDTGFYLHGRQEDLTTLYTFQNGSLVPVPPGPSFNTDAQVEDGYTYYAGGAGLLSTARDYFTFLQMILNGGEWNGNRIISQKVLEFMTEDLVGDLWDDDGHSYGFAIRRDEHAVEGKRPPCTLYWGGAFQTSYWIDPANNLIVVMKTQMTNSPYAREINDGFERIIYSAL
ncbi:MAG: class A beta-lactamase-related serine hydrolase [Balneolaceae bacterium]|nr:MAG: class A beta-lactamase-related serine hydrolase [Balneolaceae bacterium]